MTVRPTRLVDGALTSRAQLLDALAVASELEHGLSLQYLFAAFSLKKDLGEGLTTDELVATRRWAGLIFFVAAQEMLHLAQVSNLIVAIGGAPHLGRPNFPQPAGTYPPELGWELTGFSDATLARFVAYESPRTVGSVPGSEPPDPSDPIVPSRLTHRSIGEMYDAIEHAIEHLAVPGSDLFIGRPEDQIAGHLVDFPQLVEVTDRASARRAVELIVHQGEGTRADRVDSHLGIFRSIREELAARTTEHAGFRPARPVADDPLRELHPDNRPAGPDQLVNLIEDPTTAAVQDLFTASYDALLLSLFRCFAGARGDPAAAVLHDVVLGLMMDVVRPLGELLTQLPMGPSYGALTAGPSFETYPEIELLPHGSAARLVVAERLSAVATAAAVVATDGELGRVHTRWLRDVSSRLNGFAAALRG